MTKLLSICAALAALIFAGCATSYSFTSSVPKAMRTVAVPTFENRTLSAELGPIATQYTLREFQRDGTFAIRRTGDSALEVQGVIIDATRHGIAFDRAFGRRADEYRYRVTAQVSFINRKTGKVLENERKFSAETTFLAQGDTLTSQRNAAQRVAADLARQIVDAALNLKFDEQ